MTRAVCKGCGATITCAWDVSAATAALGPCPLCGHTVVWVHKVDPNQLELDLR